MKYETNQIDQSDYLLRLSDIVRPNGLLPISRSTFWKGVKAGTFPKPIKLGPRTTCWRHSDINKLVLHGVTN